MDHKFARHLRREQTNVERKLWSRHVKYLERFLKRTSHADEAERLGIGARLRDALEKLQSVDSDGYLEQLRGTLGTQPISQFVSTSH